MDSGTNFGTEKYIPTEHYASCSLITVKVKPNNLRIMDSKFELGKKLISFADGLGHAYNYLPITDRGFPGFIKMHHVDDSQEGLRLFISKFKEIFLRVGVGRQYCPKNSDKDGYWLQVNGIYGYPEVGNKCMNYPIFTIGPLKSR